MRKKILPFTAFFMMLLSGLIFSSSIIDAQTKRGTYTTTADVPLRAGPGTNHPIITTLPKGIKIDVVSKEGSWLKVESKHGDKPGYIEERFAHLETTAKTPAPKTVTPTSVAGAYRTVKDVDLREGPGTKYKVVTKLPAGLKVNVVRAEGDWLRVESKKGGKPGYLEKKSVERWTNK
jgi:mannosyl-glycoprotein endo-beta-N-acetylglucosaminidase